MPIPGIPLQECHIRRPQVDFFDRGRWAVCRAWAAGQLEQGQLEQGQLEQGQLEQGQLEQGDWSHARAVFAAARQSPGDDGGLQESEAAFWLDHLEHLQPLGRHAEAAGLRQWRQNGDLHLTRPDP